MRIFLKMSKPIYALLSTSEITDIVSVTAMVPLQYLSDWNKLTGQRNIPEIPSRINHQKRNNNFS